MFRFLSFPFISNINALEAINFLWLQLCSNPGNFNACFLLALISKWSTFKII